MNFAELDLGPWFTTKICLAKDQGTPSISFSFFPVVVLCTS